MTVGKLIQNTNIGIFAGPLVTSPPAANSIGVFLQVPAGTQFDKLKIFVFNKNPTTETISLYLYPFGSAGAYSDLQIIGFDLMSGRTLTIEDLQMNDGDRISIMATNSNVLFSASGLVIT